MLRHCVSRPSITDCLLFPGPHPALPWRLRFRPWSKPISETPPTTGLPPVDASLIEALWHDDRDALLLVDDGGRVRHANAAATALQPSPAALGPENAFWQAYPADLATRLETAWEQRSEDCVLECSSADGQSWRQRYRFHWQAGDGLHLLRIRDQASYLNLDQRLTLLTAAVEQIREPLVITDAHSKPTGDRVVWANAAFYQLLGYTESERASIRVSTHYPAATRDLLRRLLPTAAAGHSISGRSEFLRRDGSRFEAQWSITPLYGSDGMVRWWLMTGRDTSEQSQIDALLAEQRALKRETRGMAQLSDMVAGVAHDFNNALTVIQNLTSFALEDLASAAVDENSTATLRGDLAAVLEAAADASDLARGLTAFGRRGSQMQQAAASFDFDRSVEQIVQVLRRALPKRIEVVTDLACEQLVEGSESMLQQVLYNLLVNAGAAIPERGRIIVSSRRQHSDHGRELVELCVSDDGIGMTPEVQDRVLEPYFTTKGEAGSGLGLSTVHALVEQHRGRLSIDSEPGLGTRIRILLPLAPLREEQTGTATRQALVVDDDPMILQLLSRLLGRYGWEAETAVSGQEALARERPLAPALIIVDLRLGQDSGIDVGSQLRERYPGADLVLTTGGLLPADSEPLFPFRAVLRKPFTAGDVGRLLRTLAASRPAAGA